MKLKYYFIIYRVESSKTELLEERHKWQKVYQPVHENHLDSLLENRMGSRDPDNKRDSGVRELNFDDPPSPTIDQVCRGPNRDSIKVHNNLYMYRSRYSFWLP